MQKVFINDLSNFVNKEIVSYFLVSQKELREGAKDFYLRLKITDKTGSCAANIWNNAKSLAPTFDEGDIVKIKGMVIDYKGQTQVSINKIKKANEEDFDMVDFIQTSDKDPQELLDNLFSFIESMKNEHLKELLTSIFDDKEFLLLYSKSPAAKSWHHNYVGGLLEHSISVAKICAFAAEEYPVDKDLLVTGALLHDIGKVYEYNQKSTIEFTTIGRLIGHLTLGDQMICERAKMINNFPQDLLMKIRHLILSHHGEYEKATVRLPQTIEAIVLHFADNLDAQTIGVKQLMQSAASDAEWSEFDKLNSRYYFMK